MCGQLPPNHRRSMIATDAPRRAGLVGGGLAGRAGADDHEVEGLHRVSVLGRPATVALPDGLVQDDGRGDRDVQAVGDAAHRERIGSTSASRQASRQAVRLAAEDDRERPAQVGVGVGRGGVDVARDDADAALARARRGVVGRSPRRRARAKIVPSDARIAFGLNRSVRGSAAITASAPAPSAVRSTAPRLPGFSTPSTTTTSGVVRQDEIGRAPGCGRPTIATIPSERSPKATLARTAGLDRDRRRAVRGGGRRRRARRASGAGPRRRTPLDRARRRRAPGGSRGRRRRSSGRSRRARAGRAGGPRP